jgi:hypothetical protein
MGYNMAFVRMRHPSSHIAAAAIVPELLAILLLTRNPKVRSKSGTIQSVR